MKHPLQHIYDRIPAVNCKGHCGRDRHNSCCGPIGCTPLEAKLLDEYDGIRSPWINVDGGMRMSLELLTGHIFPHLNVSGRCSAYEVRPTICRLWGTTKPMACPWGCKPDRMLSTPEVGRILDAAERAAEQHSKHT